MFLADLNNVGNCVDAANNAQLRMIGDRIDVNKSEMHETLGADFEL